MYQCINIINSVVFGVATTGTADMWRKFLEIGFVDAVNSTSIPALGPNF